MKKTILFVLAALLLNFNTFAVGTATPSAATAAQPIAPEMAAQVNSALGIGQANATKKQLRLQENLKKQLAKLDAKDVKKAKAGDLKGLLKTIGIILIIVGLVGIALSLLGIPSGIAGGGTLILGLILYLIAVYAL